jgi:hypothetical protein
VHRDLLFLTIIFASACLGHGVRSTPATPVRAGAAVPIGACAAVNGSPTNTVITAPELQRSRAPNLFDAIRLIRPSYFTSRGPQSIFGNSADAIVLIVNHHVIGSLEELHSIGLTGLICVRRLSPPEVALMTGTSVLTGGIELVYGGD